MDKIIKDLLNNEITDLAKKKFKNFAKEAISDAAAFLQETEDDFKRWSTAVAEGKMSIKDFKWLVKSKQDRAKMGVLKDKGITQIEIDKFREAVLDLILKRLL